MSGHGLLSVTVGLVAVVGALFVGRGGPASGRSTGRVTTPHRRSARPLLRARAFGPPSGTRRPRPLLLGRRVPPPSVAGRARTPARWASGRDLAPLVVAKGRHPPAGIPGRLVLGRVGRRLVAAEAAQSIIVFGPTQSHKTSGFAVPAILGWQGPVLATSVKTDLFDETADHRRALGTVACFDPSGTTGLATATWSPVSTAGTWPGARRSASALVEVAKASVGTMSDGDFWYATAAKTLAPLLFAAATSGRSLDDVVRWVATGEETDVLELLSRAGVEEAMDAAISAFGKEDRQRSSIATTVETVLEPFAGAAGGSPGGFVLASEGSTAAGRPAPIDPARLVAAPNTLYLCAPAHDQRRLTPVFSAAARAVLDHVYDRVARTHRPLDPPLLVVLDEAANIAPLPDLDALASTAAGHGIQLVTVWHDLAQIAARYGAKATTVVNNHRAKLFLSGISDPQTLDYASHLIGSEEVVLPATTSGGTAGTSTTHTPTTRPLAAPDHLRRIAPGEGVLVYGSLAPAPIRLRTWFDDRCLSALVRSGPGARSPRGYS